MKHKKFNLFIILAFLFVAVAGFYGNSLKASASETVVNNLHSQTKIYSSNNDDYFDGCEDYDDYVNSAPTITVLTHGLGSSAYYWSNNYSTEDGKKLAYNSSSIINKIYQHLNGQMTLYVAYGKIKGSTYDFNLTKYSYDDYMNSRDGTPTSIIDDVSKHIVIVYNSSVPNKSNYTVYNEFHTILDNISAQYKNLTGVLPRFNLVGHSRGGITNIMYATEHPYNVASVFSMGAPYSGSVLGQLDVLLEMMEYIKDGKINEGAESIMNKAEMQGIRDAWNRAYTADVNMNVVAYGSMTSIHLLGAMIDDINANSEKYAEKYGTAVRKYYNLIKSVINVTEDCPGLASTAIDFIEGLAEVFRGFGYDLYDIVFTKINPNLEGEITYEEVSSVLSLVNVINNEFVIMDDLFIDLNSQLGYGFEDGVSYNGFKRYTKIFGRNDYTENRAIPSQPGVVHNLEIMNETYVNNITNSLVFGTPTSAIVELRDDFNGSYSFNSGKAFSFASLYNGTRKFTANGCTIKLFQYDANNCLQEIESEQNSLTYEYNKNTRYLLIAEAESANNIGVTFNLEDKMGVGNNSVKMGSGDKRVYKLTSPVSGYYLISVSDTDISLSGATSLTSGKYYVHLKANTAKYIYLTNSTSYSITVNVKVYEPSAIQLNQITQIADGTQKVMKFTNTYNSSMAYKLDISWSSGTKYATIYNSNGSSIASVTTNGTNKTYSFTLSANQTCYVIYSVADSSITSNLYINPTQLRWKVNDKLYDSTRIQLPRGRSYTIDLAVINHGTILDYESPYVNTSSPNFNFSDNTLTISKDALIGYDITIYPTLAPDYLLTVQIGYCDVFGWHASNSDSVELIWSVGATFDRINFTITNKNGTYTLSKSTTQLDITDYLPISIGTTTIKLNSLVINGITFNNGTEFLNASNIIVNNLFWGGSGTSASPYTIGCTRHLDNVRYATSSHYKVISRIKITKENWIPINAFYGVFDGGMYPIKNLTINISLNSTGNMYYGLFSYCYGTIENVCLYNPTITNPGNNPTYFNMVGCIVGNVHSGGLVYNCDVYNATMNFKYAYRDQIGIIAGQNHGTIDISYTHNATFSTCCYTGGTVGFNCGTVTMCRVTGRIDVLWESENKGFGGIAGYNRGSISSCNFGGHIEFDSPQDGRKICPMLGYIIGWNNGGTYSNNTTDGASFHYEYYYGLTYNQSKYFFKVDDKKIGRDGD